MNGGREGGRKRGRGLVSWFRLECSPEKISWAFFTV